MNDKPQRLTKQTQQEYRSKGQFQDRLAEYGWTVVSPPDLGEDFIVIVYLGGRATGISFFVQLKSVTKLKQKSNGQFVSYQIFVKDLLHWEDFAQPIVLVIWDVEIREGRWVLVSDAIKELDRRNSTWRNQINSKPVIRIPLGNDTSDSGLARLRIEIGLHNYSLIAKDKNLQVQLQAEFPNDPDGLAAIEQLRLAIEEGEQFTLSNKYLASLKFPDWWEKWFIGDMKPVSLTIKPAATDYRFRTKVSILGRNGEAETFLIDCRKVREGSKILLLESLPNADLLELKLKMRNQNEVVKADISWNVCWNYKSVSDAVRIVRLSNIMQSGGRFIIEFPDLGSETISANFKPQAITIPANFELLVQKLLEIQNRTGNILEFPVGGFGVEDTNAIEQAYQIVMCGTICATALPFEITLHGRDGLEIICERYDEDRPVELRATYDNYTIRIGATDVNFGKCARVVTGYIANTLDELKARLAIIRENESTVIHLTNIKKVDHFEEWKQK